MIIFSFCDIFLLVCDHFFKNLLVIILLLKLVVYCLLIILKYLNEIFNNR